MGREIDNEPPSAMSDPIREVLETLEWGQYGHCLMCHEFARAYDPSTGVTPGRHKPDCVVGLAIEQLKAEGRWAKWEFA